MDTTAMVGLGVVCAAALIYAWHIRRAEAGQATTPRPQVRHGWLPCEPAPTDVWQLPIAVFSTALRAMRTSSGLVLTMVLVLYVWTAVTHIATDPQAGIYTEHSFRPGLPWAKTPTLPEYTQNLLRSPVWLLHSVLPRVPRAPLSLSDHPLLLAALAGVLVALWARPPSWLKALGRRVVVAPMLLSLAGAVVAGVLALQWLYPVQAGDPWEGVDQRAVMTTVLALGMTVLAAPLCAVLLHLFYQAVTRGTWDPEEAIKPTLALWPQVAYMLLLLVYAPAPLAGMATGGSLTVSARWAWCLSVMHGWTSVLQWAIVVLLLLPWVLIDRRPGFWAAVRESLALLWRQIGRLGLLMPGYLVIVFPLYILSNWVNRIAAYSGLPWHVGHLALPLLSIFLTFCMVAIYLQLRDADAAREDTAVAEADDEGADIRPGEAAGDIQT